MPVYEYRCTFCSYHDDIYVKLEDLEKKQYCPECSERLQKKELARVITGFNTGRMPTGGGKRMRRQP